MGSVADGKCWQWQRFLAHFSFSTLLQAASSDLPQAVWTPCCFFFYHHSDYLKYSAAPLRILSAVRYPEPLITFGLKLRHLWLLLLSSREQHGVVFGALTQEGAHGQSRGVLQQPPTALCWLQRSQIARAALQQP